MVRSDVILKDQLSDLQNLAGTTPVLMDYPTAGLVTFKCGGPAAAFAAPDSLADLQALLQAAHDLKLATFILGGGSNVLFRDPGFQGLVLSTSRLDHLELLENHRVKVGAGLPVAALTAFTIQTGLGGFEWACGLPGFVGGGLFMNARCYGSSFADITEQVTALDSAGKIKTLTRGECQFAYKHSLFQTQPWTIVEAVLQLRPEDPEHVKTQSDLHLRDRTSKHQFDWPSAGCVFKNDHAHSMPSGQLLEDCGLKGYSAGGARVFEHHANFIINWNSATATDVEAVMHHMQQEVQTQKGVWLEPEIRLVG